MTWKNNSYEHKLASKGVSTKETKKWVYVDPLKGLFTERELLHNKVSYDRLLELINNPEYEVVNLTNSTNNYGEFWFVTLHHKKSNRNITFYGLGFNWARNRYIVDEFGFYRAESYDKQEPLDKKDVWAILHLERKKMLKRNEEFKEEANEEFEMLADVADEDYAYSHLYM